MKQSTLKKTVKTPRKPAKSASRSTAASHECLVAEDMFDRGMGSVWISRKLPGGKLSASLFLLDTLCLGVKNAMLWEKIPQWQYEGMQMMNFGETLVPIKPCCAKKLVTEAVAYAESLGFKPHEDYQAASVVLEGIDTSDCEADYEFGNDGRPFYIPGPEDTPKIIARITAQLQKSCGKDGFDVMTEEDMAEDEESAVTIDDPEEVEYLLAGLEALLPCEARFEERNWKQLVKQMDVLRGKRNEVTIEKLSYAGDFGGIMCHLKVKEQSIVCSLTHLRFRPNFPLSKEITDYQKQRVKKLKKQEAFA